MQHIFLRAEGLGNASTFKTFVLSIKAMLFFKLCLVCLIDQGLVRLPLLLLWTILGLWWKSRWSKVLQI